MKDQEIEVKFFLGEAHDMENRLRSTGAVLAVPRVFEQNLRFDLPDGRLGQTRQVLRLRRDTQNIITYKGAGENSNGALSRRELEVTVDDFDTARLILEALGYRVMFIYEKYRTTFHLGELEMVVDELPYGFFCEIEGPDGDAIHVAAEKLGLDWDRRIMASYADLFKRLQAARNFKSRDLTFSAFEGMVIQPEDMGISVGWRRVSH